MTGSGRCVPLAGRPRRRKGGCMRKPGTAPWRPPRARWCPGARARAQPDDGDQVAFLDDVALGHGQLQGETCRRSSARTGISIFIDSRITRVSPSCDLVALGRHDLPHVRDHLRADLGHVHLLASSPASRRQGFRHHHCRCQPGAGRSRLNHRRVVVAARELAALASSSAWNGRLVLGPVITKAATASAGRSSASSRSAPCTHSLASSGS
jgi:hypothetical protein